MRRPNDFDRDDVAEQAANWRQETMEHYLSHPGQMIRPPSWRREGLETIANEAIKSFQENTGIRFPYNMNICAPYHGRSRYRNHRDMEVAEKVFRFCGWLMAAVNFRNIRFNLRHAFSSGRGMNSPYTLLDPWAVAERFPSPGSLDRLIGKARFRANEILRPYGLRVSREAVCFAISSGSKRVGKMAVNLAAMTISQYCQSGREWKYLGHLTGSSREILMKARGLRDSIRDSHIMTRWAIEMVEDGQFACIRDAVASGRLSADETDGVLLWVDSATHTALHGVTAVKGWSTHGNKYWLVKAGGRSYHSDGWQEAREAVRNTLWAWRRQRQLERHEKKILDSLQPDDREILIWREDSYASGNCEPGTRAFANRSGWTNREFVPAAWLIKHHLGNPAVQRTLQYVAKKFLRLNSSSEEECSQPRPPPHFFQNHKLPLWF